MIPRLFIEPLQELDEAACWATAEELVRAVSFSGERRRREFLTWRAIVRRELGRHLRIEYNELGAPVLPDGEAFLSVAHCERRVAVILSPWRCAVDIEPADRDFSRVVERIQTPSELLLSSDPLWPGFVWCAKETLYKYAGCRGLDFREDLCIVSADLAAGRITGRIGAGTPLELEARCMDGCLVTSLF